MNLTLLRDARDDFTYAVRLFARQPTILLMTIVGLALGLGIATAAFSIMNAAVLSREGVVDSDRAPGILRTDRSVSTTWKYAEFLHLREGSTRMQVEAVLRCPSGKPRCPRGHSGSSASSNAGHEYGRPRSSPSGSASTRWLAEWCARHHQTHYRRPR
jgi:hypothetical protein